jgi:succinyl-CoA synthetase beta subunit
MYLHEFQAKALLARHGVPVPEGRVVTAPAEAEAAARAIAAPRLAVKAQVHAGGRGLAGGVRIVDGPAAAAKEAGTLIGRRLVTEQTRAEGSTVKQVYIEAAVDIARSIYVALVVDRKAGRLAILASPEGGEDIEVRDRRGQGRFEELLLDTRRGAPSGDFKGLAQQLQLEGTEAQIAAWLFGTLARVFVEVDASLIEINPLALTTRGELVAVDVKMALDDNALFRHPDLAKLRDEEERDPVELAAQQHQINYVRMEGNIGVVVNGAGLALATLDMLRDAGGKPANFMDIRTTASSLDIARGFELLLARPELEAVLVNVHGGGLQRCDTIVEGIGIALKRAGRTLPIVTRLAGNNADFAHTLLGNYGINSIASQSMSAAVALVVAIANRERR